MEKNKKLLGKPNDILLEPNNYSISFWVSSRYKVDRGTDQYSDLFCFDDMKAKTNCIEKDYRPMKTGYRKDKNEDHLYLR